MAGFFIGLRIKMCASEVLARLKILTTDQLSHLALASAQLETGMLNERMPGGMSTGKEMLDFPIKHSEEYCYRVYCMFEDLRQVSRKKLLECTRMNFYPPPSIQEHMRFCDIVISLWMATIGVGIKPSVRENVKKSWKLVTSNPPSSSDVNKLMDKLKEFDPEASKQFLPINEWITLSSKIPKFLIS